MLLVFERPFWEAAEGRRDFWGYCAPSASRRGEAFQFWNMHRCTGVPMLLVLHSGRAALRPREAPDKAAMEAAAIEATLESLRSTFGAPNVPTPIASMATRWELDPFARGVYSHVALGATNRDYDTMAEPLWDGSLLWAGEATCKHHPATVAGAFMSGQREAARFACRLYAARHSGATPAAAPAAGAKRSFDPAAASAAAAAKAARVAAENAATTADGRDAPEPEGESQANGSSAANGNGATACATASNADANGAAPRAASPATKPATGDEAAAGGEAATAGPGTEAPPPPAAAAGAAEGAPGAGPGEPIVLE